MGSGGGGGGLDSGYLHTRKKDFSYFNHHCGCIPPEFQSSLYRREASGSIFEKVRLQRAAGTAGALIFGPWQGELWLIQMNAALPFTTPLSPLGVVRTRLSLFSIARSYSFPWVSPSGGSQDQSQLRDAKVVSENKYK